MANLISAPVVDAESSPVAGPETRQRPVPARAERLGSLDAFRGFVMLWIIGGEGLMAGLAALGHNRVIDAIVYELNHSPWQGLRFYDCIWPSFMLMVGVSVTLSFAKRSLTQTYQQQLAHAAKRALVLFLLGSVRESVLLGSPYLIELSSALQPIAIAYFVAVLVARKSWRFPGWAWRRDPRWLCACLSIHRSSRHSGRQLSVQSQPRSLGRYCFARPSSLGPLALCKRRLGDGAQHDSHHLNHADRLANWRTTYERTVEER